MPKHRLKLLCLLVFVGFLLLWGRVVQLQIMEASTYQEKVYWQQRRIEWLRPWRGRILDCRGQVVAESRSVLRVKLDPSRLTREVWDRWVSRFPEHPWEEAAKKFRLGEKERKPPPELTLFTMPERERLFWALVETPADYPGLAVEVWSERYYPAGETGGHLLGYLGARRDPSRETLRASYGLAGIAGVEAAQERALRGRAGRRVWGRRVEKGQWEELFTIEPHDGEDVKLHVDWNWQRAAEEVLSASGFSGALVLLDCRTGTVKTAASWPPIDPGQVRRRYREYLDDPRGALWFRPVQDRRIPHPGSVFKLVTLIGAMNEGLVGEETRYECRGYLRVPGRFLCAIGAEGGAHGSLDWTEAIKVSCNIFFYELGEKMGSDRLERWARECGFGDRTGISLPGEAPGLFPGEAWKKKVQGKSWYPADSRYLGVGQLVEVTPLQVAVFYAALGNGGELLRPLLYQSETREVRGRISLPSAKWGRIREALRAVVEGSGGTACRSGLRAYEVAGKTGTAEEGKGVAAHAWFAGYFPYPAPRYSLVVYLEHGGHGGESAAPVAKCFLDRLGGLP